MDRLIRTAWRAFWVGLGASAVLIGQSVLSPAPHPGADPGAAPLVVPAGPDRAPAAVAPRKTDPVFSGNPFDNKSAALPRG